MAESLSDESSDVQKKTFTKWINSQLSKVDFDPVTDLYFDLRDGRRILALLEVLTGNKYSLEKGNLRVHQLNNVERALIVLQEQNVRLTNISCQDIVDGSCKLTLGLVWSIIAHWQVREMCESVSAAVSDSRHTSLEKSLLLWCQQIVQGFDGVAVNNFSDSWADGRVFLAIMSRALPELVSYQKQLHKSPLQRLEYAFRAAQTHVGVEPLLDPEDVCTSRPDRKSIMTYVMCLFHSLSHLPISPPPPSDQVIGSADNQQCQLNQLNELVSFVSSVNEQLVDSEKAAVDNEKAADDAEDGVTLTKLKYCFRQHQELMLNLNEMRQRVQTALDNTASNTDETIVTQRAVLSSMWQALCRAAINRQNKLQAGLASRQLTEADRLREWLRGMENRVSLAAVPSQCLPEQLQLVATQQHELQQDLDAMQPLAAELFDLIVVEDDVSAANIAGEGESNTTADSLADELCDLESHLSALSERWQFLERWCTERTCCLNQLVSAGPAASDRLEQLSEWLQQQESVLKQIEADPTNDAQQLQLQCSQILELESAMTERHDQFEAIDSLIGRVVASVGDNAALTQRLSQRMDDVKDRWDCLLQIIDACSRRLRRTGLSAPAPCVAGSSETPAGAKRRRLDDVADSPAPLLAAIDELSQWSLICRQRVLAGHGDGMEVGDQEDDQWQQRRLDTVQSVLDEVESRRDEIDAVSRAGARLATVAASSVDIEHRRAVGLRVEQVGADYADLRRLVLEQLDTAEYARDRYQLYSELRQLQLVAEQYESWLEQATEAARESSDDWQQKCKLKLDEIYGEEDRVASMANRAKDLISLGHEDREQIEADVDVFLQKWESVVNRYVSSETQASEGAGATADISRRFEEALISLEQSTHAMDGAIAELKPVQQMSDFQSNLDSLKMALGSAEETDVQSEWQQLDAVLAALSDAQASTDSACRWREARHCWRSVHEQLRTAVDQQQQAVYDVEKFSSLSAELETWLSDKESCLSRLKQSLVNEPTSLPAKSSSSASSAADSSFVSAAVNVSSDGGTGTPAVTVSSSTSAKHMVDELTERTEQCQTLINACASSGRPLFSSVRRVCGRLQPLFSPSSGSSVASHLESTVTRFGSRLEQLEKEAGNTHSRLVESNQHLSEMSQLLAMLGEMEEQLPAELVAAVPAQLDDIKQLLERLVARRGSAQSRLHAVRNDPFVSRRPEAIEFLNRWERLSSALDKLRDDLAEVLKNYDQFKKLIFAENSWLDRLKKKLLRLADCSGTDTSSDLEDLEAYIGHHPRDRVQRIGELSSTLLARDILAEELCVDCTNIRHRWQHIHGMEVCSSLGEAVSKLLNDVFLDIDKCLSSQSFTRRPSQQNSSNGSSLKEIKPISGLRGSFRTRHAGANQSVGGANAGSRRRQSGANPATDRSPQATISSVSSQPSPDRLSNGQPSPSSRTTTATVLRNQPVHNVSPSDTLPAVSTETADVSVSVSSTASETGLSSVAADPSTAAVSSDNVTESALVGGSVSDATSSLHARVKCLAARVDTMMEQAAGFNLDASVEQIHSHTADCLDLYHQLNGMKSDVQTTVASVKADGVNDSTLSSDSDRLVENYNHLGSQLPLTKARLEACGLALHVLPALESWSSDVEELLAKRFPSSTLEACSAPEEDSPNLSQSNVEQLVAECKRLSDEQTRHQASLEALQDESLLSDTLRSRLSEMRHKWLESRQKLSLRAEVFKKHTSATGSGHVTGSSTNPDVNDLDVWLANMSSKADSSNPCTSTPITTRSASKLPATDSCTVKPMNDGDTAAQQAITECQQSISSMMSALNSHFLPVDHRPQGGAGSISARSTSPQSPTKHPFTPSSDPLSRSVIANSHTRSDADSPRVPHTSTAPRLPHSSPFNTAGAQMFVNRYAVNAKSRNSIQVRSGPSTADTLDQHPLSPISISQSPESGSDRRVDTSLIRTKRAGDVSRVVPDESAAVSTSGSSSVPTADVVVRGGVEGAVRQRSTATELATLSAQIDVVLGRFRHTEHEYDGMEQQQNLKNQVPLVSDVEQRHNSRIESIQVEVAMLQPDIASLISQCDTLIYSLHGHQLTAAKRMRLSCEQLHVRWHALKVLIEVRRVAYRRMDTISRGLRRRLEDVERWLLQMHTRLDTAGNDTKLHKEVQDESEKRAMQLEAVRWECQCLAGEDQQRLLGVVDDLDRRWRRLDERCRKLLGTEANPAGLDTVSDSSIRQCLVSIDEIRERLVVEHRRVAAAPFMLDQDCRQMLNTQSPLRYAEEIVKLEEPQVTKLVASAESLLPDSDSKQLLEKAVEGLKSDWNKLSCAQQEYSSKWARYNDTWRQLQTNMLGFCRWLSEAEFILTEARPLCDQQQIEELKSTQQKLEQQITAQHSLYTAISSASREVIDIMSIADAALFLEKIENLNKRWRAVLAEVAAHRERISTVDEELSVTRQISDMFHWAESTLTLSAATVNQSDEGALLVHSNLIQTKIEELSDHRFRVEKLLWPERKFRPVTELHKLSQQLDKVGSALTPYRRMLCQRLDWLQQLYRDLAALTEWTSRARLNCQQMSPQSNTNSSQQKLRGELSGKRPDFESLTSRYDELSAALSSQQIANDLKDRMRKLTTDWRALEQHAADKSVTSAVTSSSPARSPTKPAASSIATTNVKPGVVFSNRSLVSASPNNSGAYAFKKSSLKRPKTSSTNAQSLSVVGDSRSIRPKDSPTGKPKDSSSIRSIDSPSNKSKYSPINKSKDSPINKSKVSPTNKAKDSSIDKSKESPISRSNTSPASKSSDSSSQRKVTSTAADTRSSTRRPPLSPPSVQHTSSPILPSIKTSPSASVSTAKPGVISSSPVTSPETVDDVDSIVSSVNVSLSPRAFSDEPAQENEAVSSAGIKSPLTRSGSLPPGFPSPLVGRRRAIVASAELLASLDTSISQITEWLALIKAMSCRPVQIGNCNDIAKAVGKHQIVLRELNSRLPQLRDLVESTNELVEESNRDVVHTKVSELRTVWDSTKTAVQHRLPQLQAATDDSSRWNRRHSEVSLELQHLQQCLQHFQNSASTTTATADETTAHSASPDAALAPLSLQQWSQKQMERETLHCRGRVNALDRLSRQMGKRWSSEDVTLLHRSNSDVDNRLRQLCNGVRQLNLGRTEGESTNQSMMVIGDRPDQYQHHQPYYQLHPRQQQQKQKLQQLQIKSQQLDSWLIRLERDMDSCQLSDDNLTNLQQEMEAHDQLLAALVADMCVTSGGSDVSAASSDLQCRLEQMNRRWVSLKSRALAIRNQVNGDSETCNALLLSLRELLEWVIRKSTELERVMGGNSLPFLSDASVTPASLDVALLEKQQEELRSLSNELEDRHELVDTKLQAAAAVCLESDTNTAESKSEVVRCLHSEAVKLESRWHELRRQSEQWHREVDSALLGVRVLQRCMCDVNERLLVLESVCGEWPVDNNTSNNNNSNSNINSDNSNNSSCRSATVASDNCRIQYETASHQLAAVQRSLDEVNDQAARLTDASVALLPSQLAQLQSLNIRAKQLMQQLDSRHQLLAGEAKQLSAWLAAGAVVLPWQRCVTSDWRSLPYYQDHSSRRSQWQHPQLSQLLEQLSAVNTVRFSAYRTAVKLRRLQRALALHRVPLTVLVDAFDGHGLRAQNDKLIDITALVTVLRTLYDHLEPDCSVGPASESGPTAAEEGVAPGDTAVNGTSEQSENTALYTDMCLSWLLDLYDSERSGQMRVLSFKVAIVALSRGHLEEKYRYMFRLIADEQRRADRSRVSLLLHDLLQLPRQLGEAAAFAGASVDASVRSCFEQAAADQCMTVVQLMAWMKREPQSLVWLPVLHRVAGAETARHQAKCNVCKHYPIVGFRYRCLKCFNFDMCQECFFTGRVSRSHKLTHPMHEYCTESSSGDDLRDFTKSIRNRFKSKRYFKKRPKLGYLPVEPMPDDESSDSVLSGKQQHASNVSDAELPNGSAAESDDEHRLISQYCHTLATTSPSAADTSSSTKSNNININNNNNNGGLNVPVSPVQLLAQLDDSQHQHLQNTVELLEQRNRGLQAEYWRLCAAGVDGGAATYTADGENYNSHSPPPPPSSQQPPPHLSARDHQLLSEALILREHKGRLETRMHVLEQHNRQLDQQLRRLRQLLSAENPSSVVAAADDRLSLSPAQPLRRTGTLQTRSVTASELTTARPIEGTVGAGVNGRFTNGCHGYNRDEPEQIPSQSVSQAEVHHSV